MDLTVVVPTLIHMDLLADCLMTLRHHARFAGRILVVDGNDEEGRQDQVDDIAERADGDVLHLGENRKVTGAFNAALEVVNTEYVALVHDDATFLRDDRFWPRLLRIAQCPSVGMCGPSISNCTGLQHYMRYDLPERFATYYLYGACMVFRTALMKTLGGFDEDISPCDDIELAVRMQRNGFEIVVDRGCFLMHARHMTFAITRPATGDPRNLEVQFNKIIRKHGVAAVMDHLFDVPDWDWIVQTSPSWSDIERRLNQTVPEWVFYGDTCGTHTEGLCPISAC